MCTSHYITYIPISIYKIKFLSLFNPLAPGYRRPFRISEGGTYDHVISCHGGHTIRKLQQASDQELSVSCQSLCLERVGHALSPICGHSKPKPTFREIAYLCALGASRLKLSCCSPILNCCPLILVVKSPVHVFFL